MCDIEDFVNNLYKYLAGVNSCEGNIIRIHSRKLENLGDISFPLNIKNWYHLIDTYKIDQQSLSTILDYSCGASEIKEQLDRLKTQSGKWKININRISVIVDEAHIFLARPFLFKSTIESVFKLTDSYGKCNTLVKNINLVVEDLNDVEISDTDLTTLRLLILRDVASNLINYATNDCSEGNFDMAISLNFSKKCKCIISGPILNEKGMKNTTTKSIELYNKRSSDMRMMAQHKYGVQVKPSSDWNNYFEKLGKASVVIEMLSNKPHKPCKITLNNLETSNKGASFIFYNCARFAALFREFEKRISSNIYPSMPDIDELDFTLLNQPEEWELLFVYIFQFPIVIKNCVKDIEKGVLNPQYLISFLSNLSSVFSVYYRRVRILTNPRQHLFAVIQTRICLLKALQQVFHNALFLLNIEPVREM